MRQGTLTANQRENGVQVQNLEELMAELDKRSKEDQEKLLAQLGLDRRC